jgi:L-ascorbate metabolism protein UlaG (beta-lactamase superfamily)
MMNRAHSTHFTHHLDPGIRHVLRGWNPAGGPAAHDLTVEDMRIRNVVTNIRDWQGGTDYDGNSIFVFEAAEICVAHLGHLHHPLTAEDLKALGRVDVALVPVDGGYTMSAQQMLDAVTAIGPQLIIPMHFFSQATLARFLDRAGERYPIETSNTASVTLSRGGLPVRTKVLVLPGR